MSELQVKLASGARLLVLGVAVGTLVFMLAGCFAGSSDSIPSFGEVTGTVVDDASALGIASATVTVGGVTATTTAEGTFLMRNVPTGTQPYQVEATNYQAIRGQSISVVGSSSVRLDVRMQAGNPTTGEVYGIVRDATTNEPISEVQIAVGTLTGQTLNTGYYQILGVDAGDQTVTLTATGYAPRTETVTVVAGGQHELNTSMTAITTGTVTGTVSDASLGTGVAGVAVAIESVATATTDTTGVYTLTDVPKGNHTVSFSRTDYRTVQRTVAVAAGMTTTLDTPMMSPSEGTLEGTIRNQTSGGLQAGVDVTIVELERTTTSDAQGFYQLLGVPAGAYTVYYALTDYSVLTNELVEIEGGETTVLDVELTPTVGGVVGFVFERDPISGGHGAAVSGATVRVGNALTEITTDSNGHYEVHNIPATATGTEYTIYSWSATHDLAQTQTTLFAGQIVQADDIVLDPAQ